MQHGMNAMLSEDAPYNFQFSISGGSTAIILNSEAVTLALLDKYMATYLPIV
jgi:hypothetical protein